MRPIVTVLVLIASCGCADTREAPTPISISTPEGLVSADQFTVDPKPQTVTLVTGDDLKRLQSLSSQGPGFVAIYLPGTSEPELKDYDRAFRAWQTSTAPQHSPEQVVEILGGYLGNKCIADFGMEWVTVTDEFGSDYAIRSMSVELMAFPFSTVHKRIEKKEHGFLNGVYYTIKQTLESGEYKARGPDNR